jgi:hypothetical protein
VNYSDIGKGFAGIAGLITFVGAYVYCIADYGFLLGLGLGWLPSGILAFIVGGVVYLLWPFLILAALAVAIKVLH